MSRFRRIVQSSDDEDSSHTADESSFTSINSSQDKRSRKFAISSDDEDNITDDESDGSLDSTRDVTDASKGVVPSSDDDDVPDESTNMSLDSSRDLGDSKRISGDEANESANTSFSSLRKRITESSDDDAADESMSQVVQSPPKVLPKPLARSSALPTFSTRLLPVPKEMLTLRNSSEIIVLDDSEVIEDSDNEVPSVPQPTREISNPGNEVSDDRNVVEDSGNDAWNKIQTRNSELIVIDESDDSASTNETGSLQSSSALPTASSQTSDDSAAKNLTGLSKNTSASAASTASSFSSTNSSMDSQPERRLLKRQIDEKAISLRGFEHAYKNCDLRKLNDGGEALRKKMECCRLELAGLRNRYKNLADGDDDVQVVETVKPNSIFSTMDQKTSHLGKIGMQTHRTETALTLDGLVSLHGSLETMPAEDAEETDPRGLKVELMSHQRQALAWLLHREKQTPAGGILADDMGLGKTLTMIALVMKSAELKDQDQENEKPGWQSSSSDKKHPGKTLVVCPASLIGQWDSQVKQHVRGKKLITMLHHGNTREGRGRELCRPDIVITTYGVLSQDFKNKVAAFRVAWERVILDEAHQIRNHKTQAAIAVCELEAKYRWCLTGTPFHNKQLDVYSLLKFLRCRPFDDLMVWKRWVDNKRTEGLERLNTIIKSILLRRTKEQLKSQGKLTDLPPKELHDVRVDLDEQEFSVYETVLKFSQKLVARYLAERAVAVDGALLAPRIQQLQSIVQKVGDIKTHEILVLLLRLRQICSLPGLISAMLEEDDAALADGFDKPDPVVESLFKQVRRLTISAPPPPEERKAALDVNKVLVTNNPVFDMQRSSSKMKTVLGTIKTILQNGEKVVVVSQWSSFLRHLADHLKYLPFKIGTLDGSVPVKSRGSLVDEFNDPNSKLRLLLLSLTAGGVGLNLIGANHLVIMEPHWNPQLEAQACDRIYRVGQKKPVHIYKVICKQTIEEQIEQLQKNKLEMADKVLTGQLKKELTKLSLQDLKSLFNL